MKFQAIIIVNILWESGPDNIQIVFDILNLSCSYLFSKSFQLKTIGQTF